MDVSNGLGKMADGQDGDTTQLCDSRRTTFVHDVASPIVARLSKTGDKGSKSLLGQQHFLSHWDAKSLAYCVDVSSISCPLRRQIVSVLR